MALYLQVVRPIPLTVLSRERLAGISLNGEQMFAEAQV